MPSVAPRLRIGQLVVISMYGNRSIKLLWFEASSLSVTGSSCAPGTCSPKGAVVTSRAKPDVNYYEEYENILTRKLGTLTITQNKEQLEIMDSVLRPILSFMLYFKYSGRQDCNNEQFRSDSIVQRWIGFDVLRALPERKVHVD